MARALLEAGYTVVYDDRSTVEHSHDYDVAETFSRAHIDGRFNAEWLDRICVGTARDARVLTDRLAGEDLPGIDALGLGAGTRSALVAEGRRLRQAAFEGLFEGGRATRNCAE